MVEIHQPAMHDALRIAPIDPLEDGKVTDYCRRQVEDWKVQNKDFAEKVDQTENLLSIEEKDAIVRYLAFTAYTIASAANPIGTLPENIVKETEKKAGIILFSNLTDTDVSSEIDARAKTYNTLFNLEIPLPSIREKQAKPPKQDTIIPADEDRTQKVAHLRQFVSLSIEELQAASGDKPIEMRDILKLFNQGIEYSATIGLSDPPLFNLSIGDVNLRGEIEDEFADVPEGLGLNEDGPKYFSIEQRAQAYRTIMLRAGINTTGYDGPALGWLGLADRHMDYLKHYNLDGYVRKREIGGESVEGRAVTYAGADGMNLAYQLARETLRKETGNQEAGAQILFPTPGFMMVQQIAQNNGFRAVEFTTGSTGHFLPDPEELDKFWGRDENRDVKIFVFTPINNPGSFIAPPEYIAKLIGVLKKHNILLINDLAYLGTGDEEQNKKMGEELNKYQKRIDVFPMTKIFAQPGLRCGGIFTPDENIARTYKTVPREQRLALSYPMQTQALATWDYVHMEDNKRLRELYNFRQEKLLELISQSEIFDLKVRPFLVEDDTPDSDSEENRGALYLWVPLADGKTALDVVKETGLCGTPAQAFSFSGSPVENYIRFAVGVQTFTPKNIARIKEALGIAH